MGICPCHRDKTTNETILTLESMQDEHTAVRPAEFEVRTPATDLSGSVGKNQGVPWFLGPVENYYAFGETLCGSESDRFVRACYIGTRQQCIVRMLSKSKNRKALQTHGESLERIAKLHHPFLLKVYEVFQDPRCVYIVYESFHTDLWTYLQSHGRLSQVQAATVLHQVLSALSYTHQQGIIHSQLSLRSIALKAEPTEEAITVKVMGLENVTLPHTTEEIDCIAPEERPSEKTDVWSCGVVLYALLSGKGPFPVSTKRKRNRAIPFPMSEWRGMSPEAMSLILMMLSWRQEDRPPIQQCLTHPWIRELAVTTCVTAKPVRASLAKLKFNEAGSALRDACLRFVINRVLDDSEKAEAATIFQALDQKGEGALTEDSLLRALLRIMPEQKAKERIREVLAGDANADKGIDFSEFLMSSIPKKRLLSDATIRKVFNSLDRDGNRRVSKKELKYFYRANSAPGLELEWPDIARQCFALGKDDMELHEFEELITAERPVIRRGMSFS